MLDARSGGRGKKGNGRHFYFRKERRAHLPLATPATGREQRKAATRGKETHRPPTHKRVAMHSGNARCIVDADIEAQWTRDKRTGWAIARRCAVGVLAMIGSLALLWSAYTHAAVAAPWVDATWALAGVGAFFVVGVFFVVVRQMRRTRRSTGLRQRRGLA